MGRVNFRTGFWDCYQGQRRNWPTIDRCVACNDPRNNCGMHLGSISLFVSKVGREGNWDELTFAKASGTIIRDREEVGQ